MKVLLFANGIISHGAMIQRALAEVGAARIVCADGGALHARELGLKPHTIIGDLDSLTPAQVADFKAAGCQILAHPAEKDETDLELALLHCRDIGAKTVTILGALGGRFDQTIANLLLLTLPALSAMRISLVDGEQTIRVLSPGAHRLDGQAGDTISLIPLSASVDGISTRDLKYPLRDESLRRGPARGVSNIMLSERAEVGFRRGALLLVRTIERARQITVSKRDAFGIEQLSYQGVLVMQDETCLCIDAKFALADRDLGYIQLRRGDQFREWFYSDRWYNIFRVKDVDSLAIKGWYCNITRPAQFGAGQAAAEDLALDVFVYPDGRTLLLDEAEFAELNLAAHEREKAWQAVASIKALVAKRLPPFDEIRDE